MSCRGMVLVANCGSSCRRSSGLRRDIAPDDGWLDVLALRLKACFQSLSAFFELALRPANGTRRLWFGRGRTVRVEVLEAPAADALDGEPWGDAPFEARLLRPRSLSSWIPLRAPLGASRRG